MTRNAVILGAAEFSVSVDLVVLSVVDDHLDVLIERRVNAPMRGRNALPRTMVRARESLETAASRLIAELGEPDSGTGRQIGAFGEPRRDPGGRVLGVGWQLLRPRPWSAPPRHRWVPVDDAGDLRLGFDHHAILTACLDRLRDDLETTSVAVDLCPDPFTLAQLRAVYEVIWGVQLDAANFHRKFTSVPDLLRATGTLTSGSRGRPAMLYRRIGARRLPVRFTRP